MDKKKTIIPRAFRTSPLRYFVVRCRQFFSWHNKGYTIWGVIVLLLFRLRRYRCARQDSQTTSATKCIGALRSWELTHPRTGRCADETTEKHRLNVDLTTPANDRNRAFLSPSPAAARYPLAWLPRFSLFVHLSMLLLQGLKARGAPVCATERAARFVAARPPVLRVHQHAPAPIIRYGVK